MRITFKEGKTIKEIDSKMNHILQNVGSLEQVKQKSSEQQLKETENRKGMVHKATCYHLMNAPASAFTEDWCS